MTVGDLIVYLFPAVIIGWLAYSVIRGMLKPKSALTTVIERRSGVDDAPRDHVDLILVLPNKATAKLAKLSVDGAQVPLNFVGDIHRSVRLSDGSHTLVLKIGMRSYGCAIDCSVNGRYELHLRNDQLRGGLASEAKLVVATQST